MSTDDAVTVSAAEFHRNVGVYQDIALTKPVTITKNGREWTVLLSAHEYARLKRRDRRVIAAGQLSGRQVDATRNARIPDRFADLDKEIKDRRPCRFRNRTPVSLCLAGQESGSATKSCAPCELSRV